MAGYSGTPLAKKLGLGAGQTALLINVPERLREISAFDGFAVVEHSLPAGPQRQFDYIHVFETQRLALEEIATALFRAVKREGMVWISWPKKSSKVPTNITEDFCAKSCCQSASSISRSARSMRHGRD